MNETTITVAGRLVADPVIRQTQRGRSMTTFRVATNSRRPRAGTTEYEDGPTSFYHVTTFRALAANAAVSLHKGDPVVVTGTLEVSSFDRQDGSKGNSADITAWHVGHDMGWGVSVFTKVARTAPEDPQGTDPFHSAAVAYGGVLAGRVGALVPGPVTEREDPRTTSYDTVDDDGVVRTVEHLGEEPAA